MITLRIQAHEAVGGSPGTFKVEVLVTGKDQIKLGLFGRSATLELYRKLDFELLLFAYFVGTLAPNEMIWPTSLESLGEGKTKSKAAAQA